ncbi:tyrosine-type recombinase/integrase [Microbacterium sp. ZW T5_45]|uniref:tyrosine-type recombinase/integrase n=1 Tax=Microbacterium sp. ZW T5_45 TaxID=3378080 RepID=UPI0038538A7C
MADIDDYMTKAGKRYMVRYRKPDKSQTKKRGFRTKKEAELFLAKITTAKAEGDYIDPARGRTTVSDISTAWLRKKSALKPSSFKSIDTAWRVHVEPKWGSRSVSTIEPTEVENWIQDMVEGVAVSARERVTKKAGAPLSATVILRAMGVLGGILDDAMRDRRIGKNPARRVTNLPRKVSKKDRRYLTDAEVARLAGAVKDPQLAVLVLVLAYCGIRWGEAIGLRVKHVNFLRHRLHIRENAVQVNADIHVGEPKSWERRTVPFPAFLTKALEKLTEDKGPNDLVFASATGSHILRPRTSETSGSWFVAAQRAADIPLLTIHDLRHTAASLAISAGANVKVVQKMLGHKSAAMTLDTYADLFDDDLDSVAELMNTRGKDTATAALKLIGMSA